MLLDFLESVGNAVNNGIQSIGSGARDFHVDNNSYYTNSVLSDIEHNTWRTANAMEEINRRGKRQEAPRERNSRRAYVRREAARRREIACEDRKRAYALGQAYYDNYDYDGLLACADDDDWD
ncbi:MAG: hypothetical protein HDR38_06805 [Treponema sp.]|nr:hypothetical protein [Treponema sp.]